MAVERSLLDPLQVKHATGDAWLLADERRLREADAHQVLAEAERRLAALAALPRSRPSTAPPSTTRRYEEAPSVAAPGPSGSTVSVSGVDPEGGGIPGRVAGAPYHRRPELPRLRSHVRWSRGVLPRGEATGLTARL